MAIARCFLLPRGAVSRQSVGKGLKRDRKNGFKYFFRLAEASYKVTGENQNRSFNPGRSSPDQMVSERLKTNFTHIQIEPETFYLSHKSIIFRELFDGFILKFYPSRARPAV